MDNSPFGKLPRCLLEEIHERVSKSCPQSHCSLTITCKEFRSVGQEPIVSRHIELVRGFVQCFTVGLRRKGVDALLKAAAAGIDEAAYIAGTVLLCSPYGKDVCRGWKVMYELLDRGVDFPALLQNMEWLRCMLPSSQNGLWRIKEESVARCPRHYYGGCIFFCQRECHGYLEWCVDEEECRYCDVNYEACSVIIWLGWGSYYI